MAKPKSKWFVVATEGATTDGRALHREWIEQMAEQYDPKNTYGARINLEHIRLRWYDRTEPHSHLYGDVLALKAQERDDGKLQLLAELAPTESLIELVKQKQKVYTSVEINPNFADTGKAYLVGLAVTDSPASLGTEYLTFCAGAKHSPLADRKQHEGNLFTAAVETELEFTEEAVPVPWLEKFKAMFSKAKNDNDGKFAEHEKAMEMLAEKFSELSAENSELKTELSTVKTELAAAQQQAGEFTEKFAKLEQEPSANYTPRPKATGGNVAGEQKTDF